MLRIIIIVIIIILIGIQFVPVSKTNPPVTGEIKAPDDVMQILRTSCYDCHSNEVVWPWYSNVAPMSWLVAYDVDEAREHLNFSEWASYSADDKAEDIEEIWEEVEEGKMPLWYYLPLHPEARLSDADKQTLKIWVESGGS
ncbi:MAG: cytochrome c [Thermodesulfobacteriota bacterium]|nr:MAG: cytochrome c [Thermodesulfobacteriota bacterium]